MCISLFSKNTQKRFRLFNLIVEIRKKKAKLKTNIEIIEGILASANFFFSFFFVSNRFSSTTK
jgi:hypothetical protein